MWHDGSTTDFLRELLNDLRDKIWGLKRDNTDLRRSISEAREELEEMLVHRAEAFQLRRRVAEQDTQLAALGERVKKLEKERVLLLLAILACVCVCVAMILR